MLTLDSSVHFGLMMFFPTDVIVLGNVLFLVIFTSFITGELIVNIERISLNTSANIIYSTTILFLESSADHRFRRLHVVLPVSFFFLFGEFCASTMTYIMYH